MALLRNGQYVILARADDNQILIQDPLVGRPQVVSPDEFAEGSAGGKRSCLPRGHPWPVSERLAERFFAPAEYRIPLLRVPSQTANSAACGCSRRAI